MTSERALAFAIERLEAELMRSAVASMNRGSHTPSELRMTMADAIDTLTALREHITDTATRVKA